MRGRIVERFTSADGSIVIKVYDTGQVGLNIIGRGAHVIEQAWLSGQVPTLLLLSPTPSAPVVEASRTGNRQLCECGHAYVSHSVNAPEDCMISTCHCNAFRKLPVQMSPVVKS